jgi:hypothetical protein
MLLGIDHVVIACHDPDEAAALIERQLGLEAAAGGRHEALGTANRIVWLGDSYVELVGIADEAVARGSWLGRPVLAALGDAGGGLVTWAVAVDDLDETLRWVPPDSGLIGPVDGERRRPDGRIVRWRLARPEELAPASPFIIEHDERAAEWTPEERAARAAAPHPIGGRVRLAAVELVTTSPPVAAGRIRRLLAAGVEPAGRGAVRIRLGGQEVRLVTRRPGAASIVDLVVNAPLRTRTGRIGDCEIRLRGRPAEVGAAVQPDDSADV